MNDRINETICPTCGELVYATFQTTWTAAQQAANAMRWHVRDKHPEVR